MDFVVICSTFSPRQNHQLMNNKFITLVCLFICSFSIAQIQIQDSVTNEPISFATISFGNGNGLFADDEGKFTFTKKLYRDIDTLFITSLGYENLKIATENLPELIKIVSTPDELQAVIVKVKPKGKYKEVTVKPVEHQDYFSCWLPTIESEIAVFFPNTTKKPTKVVKLLLPVKLEARNWDKRKQKNAKKRPFSTLFKVHFYENDEGFPGDVLSYEKVTFRVTEQSENVFELDIDKHDIFLPKEGFFVSIQILGYTDKMGKLLPNKKYQEIKTKRGIVKVSTTFRPLLPFTNQISTKRTFIKRVFLDDNQWLKFEKKNVKKSKLLLSGMNNYGMGLELNVYKKQN